MIATVLPLFKVFSQIKVANGSSSGVSPSNRMTAKIWTGRAQARRFHLPMVRAWSV